MNRHRIPCRLLVALTLAGVAVAALAAETATPQLRGRREQLNGCLVVHLTGTGEQMGQQQARLLRSRVRRVLKAVILEGEGAGHRYASLIKGAMVMERYLPPEYRAELQALAAGAEVKYEDLVALQLFGDVQRGQHCSSYAAFGPATANGECIVGRNMDFYDHGVSEYAACLLDYKPSVGIPFVTASWCGVINGWTAMNACGIVCANNSAYGGQDSLEGLSTCFMVRKVAQYAHTVAEGVRIVQQTPRACGTNLIIAGGNPPAAAIVEFDHKQVVVRWAKRGYVTAANGFRVLGRVEPQPDEEDADTKNTPSYWLARDDLLSRLIRENYGRIDDTMNFAAAEGVPMRSMNLQSALLFPQRRAMWISMGKVPAADQPFRRFRLTGKGLAGDE